MRLATSKATLTDGDSIDVMFTSSFAGASGEPGLRRRCPSTSRTMPAVRSRGVGMTSAYA
ncbi:MAG: hypothetical protein H6722_11430 [Sandaracinus sp.]|nr:hypothetical protein [Sandaracinus sp.]